MERSGAGRYRFGVFEVDTVAGEVWRQGLRVRMHRQPFQVLCLLLRRSGEVVTREEIARELWPEGTFVDFEHGVNAAVNRLREGLRDKAAAPRYIETLPRRGYRFLGPVEVIEREAAAPALEVVAAVADQAEAGNHWLTTPEVLPALEGRTPEALFLLLQAMYLGFYLAALANLLEVRELLSVLPGSEVLFVTVAAFSACCIPLRLYLGGLAWLHPPLGRARYLRLWPFLLGVDLVGALSPLLLVHHISFGLALALVCPLVYAPFAQRSLVLMGAIAE